MTSAAEPAVRAPRPFDAREPVGEGITVLEASAGTGKTHAVASLVVAEVAHGRPLDELLVVTFTRKATGTLRERVWQRLAAACAALDAVVGGAPAPDEPLLAHLAECPTDELVARRDRLSRAVSDFDAATIATTHGFCQQVLASLGVAGDAERSLEVVDSVRDLVVDAVDDLFVRRFHGGGPVLFSRDEALRIAEAVVANPDARIGPVDDNDADRLRRRFASTLRERIEAQKRRGRLLTYDDLLTRLAASIDDPVRGAVVAERLRRRYSMAIVDEFQDTDTVQWRILRDAFGVAPCRLVLVGDPKQAVYAFRGGDVVAYLHATAGATARCSLDVSWRSDQPLLDALDAVFDGAEMGDPSIRHRPLRARPGAEAPRLVPGGGAPSAPGEPFVVRVLDRGSGLVERTPTGLAQKGSAFARIAADVADEARHLLSSGAVIVERDAEGRAVDERPVRPADIAVLVRRHREAEQVRAALSAAGVPVVVHGGAAVFATPAAHAWLDLLRALENPASSTRVRAVVRGPFVGWDTRGLDRAGEREWEEIDERIHDWSATLRTRGVAALVRRIEVTGGLGARVLASVGGERTLSDLHHVAELLDASPGGRPVSLALLVAWLTDQIATATTAGQGEVEGARRRLASDAAAVAVHTVHGAKGLEFPVVLLPSLWTAPWSPDDAVPVFHDDAGVRCLGVGASGRVHRDQVARARAEQDDEDLRLLYVALTRARHRVVVWWATGADARRAPLARMLLGREPGSGVVARELRRAPDEQAIRDRVAVLAAQTGGALVVEDVGARRPAPAVAPEDPRPDLAVARVRRRLDDRWVRTSYSALTAAAHDLPPLPGGPAAGAAAPRRAPGAATVVDVVDAADAVTVDEPLDAPGASGPPAGHSLDLDLALAEVPGGARVGTMVHEVLEAVDLAAPGLVAALERAVGDAGGDRLVAEHTGPLVAGLAAAIESPFGPTFGTVRLRDLARSDRLDELAFDLPLAGGEHPTGAVTMDAIADLFASELPPGDPCAHYHHRLREPILATEVRGYLTGSIDLVARHRDDHGDLRHVVVDYKTNRLAPAGVRLTAWHYRPEALAAAMADAHYPLQAALYAVALHRYLRWRQPGYDPERHLGGVAYLFLRGMAVVEGGEAVPAPLDADAPGGPAPCGVFAWHPPASFVLGLSDVLDGGRP